MKQNNLRPFLLLVAVLLLTACGGGPSKEQSIRADKLIETAYKTRDYNRLVRLADSLEREGSLSQPKAYYWLGYANDRLKKTRMAEFYWKSALEAVSQSTDPESIDIYVKCATRLANLLSVRGDYEGTLRVAEPAAERLEALKCDSTSDFTNLLIYIGCCQAATGHGGDYSEGGFDRAYKRHLENIEATHSDAAYKDAIAGLINIAYYCVNAGKYNDAVKWVDRFGGLLNEYQQRPESSADYIDRQLGRFDIYKAIALEGLGQKEEAAKVYDSFQTTAFSKTPEGRISANDYLVVAGRWDEAADNYGSVDALLAQQEDSYTLVNIERLLLKKYRANLTAGRRDSAVAVSLLISDSLDGAFARANQIDREEQATIVKRVEEMSALHAEDVRQRQMGIYFLIGLAVLALIGYMIWRRRQAYKLHAAHEELKTAYVDLEADTTEKERQATQARIARGIQQALVSEPPHDSRYACHVVHYLGSMGGDGFFDSILKGDKLYFSVGDADAAGVRASLRAAVTRAQFRTAVAFESAPERILAAINGATARKGEPENLVRMFVGVLDLSTGVLRYSNAAHQLPLVMADTLSKLPADEGQPIGTADGGLFTAQELTLPAGTQLFLYTVGLTAAVNADGNAYGERRMLGAALQSMKLNPAPEPFIETLHGDRLRFTGDIEQERDTVMVVLKYTPVRQ